MSGEAAETAVPPRVKRVMWPELDLLRGLAGLAMVVNHTAVGLVPPSAAALVALPNEPLSMGPAAWASFLGSFAPMIFFFITGVGYGLQARPGGVPKKPGLWSKVAVLVLADALLWRAGGLWIGLDFFAFIAGSMVLLAFLNRLDRRWAVTLACLGFLALPVVRYGGVPVAGKLLGLGFAEALAPWTGHEAVAGVSFPPVPWLCYPLAGFVLGAAATRFAAGVDRRRVVVAAASVVLAALAVLATGFLIDRGYPLHRWGRLAPSSWAAGFAVIAALVAACLLAFRVRAGAADRGPHGPVSAAVRGLSLRGVAAFAVVPLHFLAIAVAEGLGIRTTGTAGVLTACAVVAVVALGLAPLTNAAASAVRDRGTPGPAWWAGLAVAVACLIALCVPGIRGAGRSAVASVGQLALCLLLALPLPWAGGGTRRSVR